LREFGLFSTENIKRRKLEKNKMVGIWEGSRGKEFTGGEGKLLLWRGSTRALPGGRELEKRRGGRLGGGRESDWEGKSCNPNGGVIKRRKISQEEERTAGRENLGRKK